MFLSLCFVATTQLTERNAALLLDRRLAESFSILLMAPIARSASIFSLGVTIGLCILAIITASLTALFPTMRATSTPELQHALTNLIENAARFAEHEVWIVVSVSNELVMVRIEDDGAGFESKVLAQLGEPYVASRQSAGMGLGVFIAQTLLARTVAPLHLADPGSGVQVTIIWRRAAFGQDVPEA